MEENLMPSNGELRTQMYRAACTRDESKLQPYQYRETLIKILEKTNYTISRKIGFMSVIRAFFVYGDHVMTIAPIVTGALSFYYGKTGKDLSGMISLFSTVIIVPIKTFLSKGILWAEDRHRDYLLQSMDYLVAENYGAAGTREMFVDRILNELQILNNRKVFSDISGRDTP
jgi:hypothetical protein